MKTSISEITATLANLNQDRKNFIETILRNDEIATDEEMIQFFTENFIRYGVNPEIAIYLVECERDNYLSDFEYSLFAMLQEGNHFKCDTVENLKDATSKI